MSPEEAFSLALIGSAIPIAAWLVFFYTRDRYQREPKRLILLLFLVGAIPVAAAAEVVNEVFLGFLSFAVVVVVVAPVGEEALKYLGTRITAKRSPAFDEPIDGMIYGSTVGLGFAFTENIAYLQIGILGSPTPELDLCEPGLDCFVELAVMRGLGTALIHAVATGIAGHYLARRFVGGQPKSVEWHGLGLAVLIHAGWNFGLLLPALIGGTWAYVVLARRSLAASPFRVDQLDDQKHRVEHFAVGDGLLQPCPACDRLHPAGLHKCTVCGQQLLSPTEPHSLQCINCGEPQPRSARFCSACGHQLVGQPLP